jgi:hypothetical protein
MAHDSAPISRDPQPATAIGGSGASTLARIARFSVPLWAVLATVVALLVLFAVVWFQRDTTQLGPAVRDAESITVEMTICNETVDDRGINPRAAELELEKLFENDEGVGEAKVSIERRDCGDRDEEE